MTHVCQSLVTANLRPCQFASYYWKLACQAVFVISFYDLSELGSRAAVHRCTDESLTGLSPLGEQPIDETEGVQPATSGGGVVDPQSGRAESLLKG